MIVPNSKSMNDKSDKDDDDDNYLSSKNKIPAEVATALLAGIKLDSDRFGQNTSDQTLDVARKLIKDGANGYLVPLDMNFDVNKILNIPKCKEYDNGALKKWLDYIGYKGKILSEEKLMQEYEEERNMKCKVKANEKDSIIDTPQCVCAHSTGTDSP